MNKERLYEIANDAVREEELTGNEIPNIDLYVDQIISLVSEKNKQSSERYQDRQLTKTMINNYSKDGIITPIKGKKYTKEQFVQILTVYTLKNTLSIGEIKRLLEGAYSIEGYDGEELAKTYDRYIDIKGKNRDFSVETLTQIMNRYDLDIEDERDLMLTIGALLSLSGFLRATAQAMIDERYPIPAETVEKPKKEKNKHKE